MTTASHRMPATVLATCVLPRDDRLRFDEPAFREHGRLVAGHMTRHLYVFGTAGEGYAVTEAQFREVARVFRDEARQCDVTPMLGVIGTSLGTVPERIEFGLELGYRQFQISFPAWGAVRDDEMKDFLTERAGISPRLSSCPTTRARAAVGGSLPPVRSGARPAAGARRLAKGSAMEITDQQHALLRRSRNGVLVTNGPGGSPHAGPVWYLWDGAEVRISTPGTTQKVRDIEHDPRVAFCVDDQVAGEYVTLYGQAVVVAGERVTELTWPLLLAYLHQEEASTRWARINADGSRVVIVLRPSRVAGRQQVR